MRQSLARAAPAALASVASTSSAPATALRPATQQQKALLPARRVARKIAAGRSQEQQQRRGPRPLQASTTNFRFPRLSMPGIDGALSSITSDIDAAESDGTLIDVTIRDVKVSFFLFWWERERWRERERLRRDRRAPSLARPFRVLTETRKFEAPRSTSALYRWLPESVLSAMVAVRDRGSKQRRRQVPSPFFPHHLNFIPLLSQAVSYVSRRRMDAVDFDPDEVDEEGLPLVYNEERINAFWSARLGELAGRWASFAGISAPWLTRLATAVVRGTLERDRAALARDAVDNLEKLGPTYVKLGQILSIRYVCVGPEEREKRERGERERERRVVSKGGLSSPLLDARALLSTPRKIRITLTPSFHPKTRANDSLIQPGCAPAGRDGRAGAVAGQDQELQHDRGPSNHRGRLGPAHRRAVFRVFPGANRRSFAGAGAAYRFFMFWYSAEQTRRIYILCAAFRPNRSLTFFNANRFSALTGLPRAPAIDGRRGRGQGAAPRGARDDQQGE